MWCIWRERNWRTFKDLDRFNNQLLALFSGSLFDCARVWGLTFSDSLPLFLSSLLLCNQCFFMFLLFHLFLYFGYAGATLHLAVFRIYIFLTYQKKEER